MDRDLRIVGAGLDGDVATAARRIEVVGGKVRQIHQRGGPEVGEAEAVVEQRRSETDGEGQPGGRKVQCFTGVARRSVSAVAGRAVLGGFEAGSHAFGHRGPRRQQRDQLVAVASGHIEGDEVHAILRGSDDPGLMFAAERDHGVGGGVLGGGRGDTADHCPGTGENHPRTRGAEQPTSRDA